MTNAHNTPALRSASSKSNACGWKGPDHLTHDLCDGTNGAGGKCSCNCHAPDLGPSSFVANALADLIA